MRALVLVATVVMVGCGSKPADPDGGSTGGGTSGGGGGGNAGGGEATGGSGGGTGGAGGGSAGGAAGGAGDTTPPTVTVTVPANAATAVPPSAVITVTFSEPIDCTTVVDGNLTVSSGEQVRGAVSCSGSTGTFTPTGPLAYSGTFTVRVRGIADLAGNVMAGVFTSTFSTELRAVLSGTVSGLRGGGLVLQNNGGDDRPISGNGSFSFATAVAPGAAYDVTVKTQPALPTQVCTVTNGRGVAGTAPITDVVVRCPSARFALVSGGRDARVHTYLIDATTGRLSWRYKAAAAAPALQVLVHPKLDVAYALLDDSSMAQYSINATGRLTPLTPAVVAAPFGGVDSIAMTAEGTFAFTSGSSSSNLNRYAVAANGALTALPALALGSEAYGVAVHPAGTAVYVARGVAGDVAQLTLAPDGGLTPMVPPNVTAGAGAAAVAVDPGGRYAWVSNQGAGTVSQYAIGAGGALTPLTPATVAAGSGPGAIAVHPAGTFVYVANNGSQTVSQYAVVAGALQALPQAAPPTGEGPRSIAIDPQGTSLYVSNLLTESISQYAIAADGHLTPMTPRAAASLRPTGIAVTKGDAPLAAQPLAAWVASTTTGTVKRFTFDGDTLMPTTDAAAVMVNVTVSGGRLTVHPSERFVYLAGCMSPGSTGFVMKWANGAGLTSPVLLTFTGCPSVAKLVIHPNGQFAYFVDAQGDIHQYAVDDTDGTLVPLNPALVAFESDATALAIDPTGAFAYLASTAPTLQVRRYIPRSDGVLVRSVGTTFPVLGYPLTESPSSITVDVDGKSAFVVSSTGGTITQFSINAQGLVANGKLTVNATLPLSPELALSSNARVFQFLVKAGMQGINTYSISSAGQLTSSPNLTTTSIGLSHLAVDPAGKHVYAFAESGGAASFAVYDFDGIALTASLQSTVMSTASPGDIAFSVRYQ